MAKNDRTTNFGFGLGGEGTVTSSAKKIQVRMTSGKIYGPYSRTEILLFIRQKKIKGEESILVDGESEWRAISSEIEFFDALQAVWFKGAQSKKGDVQVRDVQKFSGEKSEPSGYDEKVERTEVLVGTKVVKKSDEDPIAEVEPRRKLGLGSPMSISEREQLRALKMNLAVGESAPPPVPEERLANPEPTPTKMPSATQGSQRIVTFLVTVALLATGVYLFKQKRPGRLPAGRSYGTFSTSTWYGKPLSLVLEGVEIKAPPMPQSILGSEHWDLPQNFGASAWVADLKALTDESDSKVKSTASYWGRWAWDAMWLGYTISVFDKGLGKTLIDDATGVISELQSKKTVSDENASLFKAVPLIAEGKWDEARTILQGLSQSESAQWLAEECAWQSFWGQGARGGQYQKLLVDYKSMNFDISSRIRASFLARDSDKFLGALGEMSIEDPMSTLLWFSAAEYAWRQLSNQIQTANTLFLTGLGTLSLLPGSFQANYWQQFAEFLTAFGRQDTAALALANRDSIGQRDIEHTKINKPWWDLNQEGLELQPLAANVIDRASANVLSSRDLATLFVIGQVVPHGGQYLDMAGYHWIFEKNWPRAIKLFQQVIKINRNDAASLGGLIWGYAAQYQFDLAFQAHDKLATLTLKTPEELKFLGLIQTIGREYAEAAKNLQRYTKTVPNDGWGHYFTALLYLAEQKNVDCVKSANLAHLNSTGELRFRANLLFYRCRVLAKVAERDALRELSAMVQQDPSNIPLVLTYIDALADSDVKDVAVKTARDALSRFPRSYEFRMKLAEMYARNMDFDRALAFYTRSASDKPDSAEPWVRIGEIFQNQKHYVEAAHNFETAARIQPTFPEVWLFAARAYALAGNDRDAARMYVREIDARPAVLETFIEAAEFLLKINAPQEVPVLFRKFKADFQDDPRVLTRLAQAYLATKDYENAQSTAATALARDPNAAEPYRVLGYVYEQQGQMEESARYFQKYLVLLPQAADADVIRSKLQNSGFQR